MIRRRTPAFLSTLAAITMSAAPQVALAQAADGVTVFPVDNGGFLYRFSPTGLDVLKPYGTVQTDGFVVPFDWSVRSGCFAATKPIHVEHARGSISFLPHIRSEWRGELGGPSPLVADLFNFRLEVRKADGSVRTIRRYVDTSSMQLTLRATYPDGSQSYYGTLQNPAPDGSDQNFGNTYSVDPGDTVRLLVCDVWSGVKLVLTDVDAYSIPILTSF